MPACPECAGPMEPGYLEAESLVGGAKWVERKTRLGLGGERVARPGGTGLVHLEGHRCSGCRLLLLRYPDGGERQA